MVEAVQPDGPPVAVNIRRKRAVKPIYGGVKTDDLGYLSNYIIELVLADKLQIIKDDEKARKKLRAEVNRRDSCTPSCPCNLSVPDLTEKQENRKSVHYVGSIPTNIQSQRLRGSLDSSQLNNCQSCVQSEADNSSTSKSSNDAERESRRHRGRQHLDYITGHVREKRSR